MRRIGLLLLVCILPAIASAQSTAPAKKKGAAPGKSFRDCDGCPEMVMIPAGTFTMGSAESEPGRDKDEGPQHKVKVTSFAAGKYEVTFDEWDACVADKGCKHKPGDSRWGRGKRPVINVSWDDAQEYLQWLSQKTGKKYRLLSEAEWEYAARARTTTPFSFGDAISPQQANYDSKISYEGSPTAPGQGKTVPVGSHAPNPFGLHDVHGNAWEWVEDCWNPTYKGAPADGSAWTTGNCKRRVLRGGAWGLDPRFLRSADRNYSDANQRNFLHGLRVARAR